MIQSGAGVMTISNQDSLVKLGYSEAVAMAMVFIGAKAFLGYPRFLVEMGLNAAWLLILISIIISLLFWLLIASLLNKFPGKSLMEINQIVLGNFLGLAVNIISLLYIIISTSNLLRIFSGAVIITALPHAPISALAILFVIVMWIAAHLGLEAISRNAYISLPFIIIGITAVLLLLYPYWDVKELFPVLGIGPVRLLFNSFLNISAFGEIILLAYLAPFFSFDGTRLKNIGIFSIATVGFYFLFITVTYLMVIPVPSALENLTPFYQLSRSIYLGRYYQRLESVFIFFWIYTAFLRLSIGLILAAIVTRESLKIPYYRPLLPALCVLFFSLALTPAQLVTAISIEKYRMWFGWIFTFLVPTGVWAVALIRRKDETSA
jgi:spore germination protein (amino acid permease)